ncbi:unnamed protein product [Urochloa decumbens]|uniref:DUF4220 domain-containing protein n=1 Tax=Urochloa decumbens TaxID=240449 RepID=A0ABC9AZQ2_9POAL
MAAANMALAPSPTTPKFDEVLDLFYVVALVSLAMVAIFLLHILGPLRRWLSHGLLHHTVVGVYALSYPLVGYTIGRMQSSRLYVNDYTVWAVFLLLLLSSTDSLTVCRLSDIDSWRSIYVKQLFKGFLLVSILLQLAYDMKQQNVHAGYLWYPLVAILFVIGLKSYVMIASIRMVSNSYLGKNVKVIADYMHHIVDNNLVAFDPVTMEGSQVYCRWRETLRQPAWAHTMCEGNLLLGDRGKPLRDVCLSMALSKMLNRRFAGFKISAAELEKTKDFVFKGLLSGDKQPHLRAFRIIEEELVFVHDMYYTRYSYLYRKGRYLALCLPVIMIALCSWLTVACLLVKGKHKHYVKGTNPELMFPTIIITVVLAFLEAYQVYLYMASGWFKVALIRSYVTAPLLQKCCCSEMIIRLLLMLKAFRPWQGKLGQYCFLENLGRKSKVMNCLHYATLRLVDKAMKGRNKNSVELSVDVKRAIVDSLLGSNGRLTNGLTSLQRSGIHADLSWACNATATDGTVTRTILVWHIATTLCEHQLDKEAKEEDAVKIASTLSKYCMHLLAFVPNLLPDHSSISESILDQSIEEAGELLKGTKDLESRCEKLMKIRTHNGGSGETPLVAQGAQLAMHLIEGIQEHALRWKVLSDFWAEMMLYVSPSDDARVHLELLAKGGEFITHLWALLTHAGVLKRDPTGPDNAV